MCEAASWKSLDANSSEHSEISREAPTKLVPLSLKRPFQVHLHLPKWLKLKDQDRMDKLKNNNKEMDRALDQIPTMSETADVELYLQSLENEKEMSLTQDCQVGRCSSGIGSSHPSLTFQSCCKKTFTYKVTGPNQPIISKNLAAAEATDLFVGVESSMVGTATWNVCLSVPVYAQSLAIVSRIHGDVYIWRLILRLFRDSI